MVVHRNSYILSSRMVTQVCHVIDLITIFVDLSNRHPNEDSNTRTVTVFQYKIALQCYHGRGRGRRQRDDEIGSGQNPNWPHHHRPHLPWGPCLAPKYSLEHKYRTPLES